MSDPAAPAPELPSTTVDAAPAPDSSIKPQENGEVKVNGTATEEAAGFKVFAGNLAYATTEEGLKGFFKEYEKDIVELHLIHRGTRPAGYAFLTLSSLERAQDAVAALSGKELDGREVAVEIAKAAEDKGERRPRQPKRAKNVKRVGEVTEEEAEGKPAGGEGEAAEARIDVPATVAQTETGDKNKKKRKPRKTPQRRRKSAAGEGAAEGAEPTTNGAEAKPLTEAAPADDGAAPKKSARTRKPRTASTTAREPRAPREPRERRPAGQDPAGTPSSNMLFVANLPYNVTDATLAQLFTDAGIAVVSARVVRRRFQPRRSKGYGFVDVGGAEAQAKGVELVSGATVEGREVVVKIAVNAQLEDEHEGGGEAGEGKENAPAAPAAEHETSSPETTVLAT